MKNYCDQWGLSVNLEKSKICVWYIVLKGEMVLWSISNWDHQKIISIWVLSLLLTSVLCHTLKRVFSARWPSMLNGFLAQKMISLSKKYQLLNSVARSIACYGSQIWEYRRFKSLEKIVKIFHKEVVCYTNNYSQFYVIRN